MKKVMIILIIVFSIITVSFAVNKKINLSENVTVVSVDENTITIDNEIARIVSELEKMLNITSDYELIKTVDSIEGCTHIERVEFSSYSFEFKCKYNLTFIIVGGAPIKEVIFYLNDDIVKDYQKMNERLIE